MAVRPSSQSSASAIPALVPQGPHTGKPSMPMGRVFTLIGSRHRAHLHLLSRSVSKAHAIIVNDNGAIYLRDTASREHVFVNGEPVRESELRSGDLIKVGTFLFKLLDGSGKSGRAPVQRAREAIVEVEEGTLPTMFEGRTIVIGRRPTCDIVLAELAVSNVHAVIFEYNGQHHVRDLGSRTGVYVNGEQIHQQALKFGDQLRIGDHELRFQPARAQEDIDELEHLIGTATLGAETTELAREDAARIREAEKASVPAPQARAPREVDVIPLAEPDEVEETVALPLKPAVPAIGRKAPVPPAIPVPPPSFRPAVAKVPKPPVEDLTELDLNADPDVAGPGDTQPLKVEPETESTSPPSLSSQVVDDPDEVGVESKERALLLGVGSDEDSTSGAAGDPHVAAAREEPVPQSPPPLEFDDLDLELLPEETKLHWAPAPHAAPQEDSVDAGHDPIPLAGEEPPVQSSHEQPLHVTAHEAVAADVFQTPQEPPDPMAAPTVPLEAANDFSVAAPESLAAEFPIHAEDAAVTTDELDGLLLASDTGPAEYPAASTDIPSPAVVDVDQQFREERAALFAEEFAPTDVVPTLAAPAATTEALDVEPVAKGELAASITDSPAIPDSVSAPTTLDETASVSDLEPEATHELSTSSAATSAIPDAVTAPTTPAETVSPVDVEPVTIDEPVTTFVAETSAIPDAVTALTTPAETISPDPVTAPTAPVEIEPRAMDELADLVAEISPLPDAGIAPALPVDTATTVDHLDVMDDRAPSIPDTPALVDVPSAGPSIAHDEDGLFDERHAPMGTPANDDAHAAIAWDLPWAGPVPPPFPAGMHATAADGALGLPRLVENNGNSPEVIDATEPTPESAQHLASQIPETAEPSPDAHAQSSSEIDFPSDSHFDQAVQEFAGPEFGSLVEHQHASEVSQAEPAAETESMPIGRDTVVDSAPEVMPIMHELSADSEPESAPVAHDAPAEEIPNPSYMRMAPSEPDTQLSAAFGAEAPEPESIAAPASEVSDHWSTSAGHGPDAGELDVAPADEPVQAGDVQEAGQGLTTSHLGVDSLTGFVDILAGEGLLEGTGDELVDQAVAFLEHEGDPALQDPTLDFANHATATELSLEPQEHPTSEIGPHDLDVSHGEAQAGAGLAEPETASQDDGLSTPSTPSTSSGQASSAPAVELEEWLAAADEGFAQAAAQPPAIPPQETQQQWPAEDSGEPAFQSMAVTADPAILPDSNAEVDYGLEFEDPTMEEAFSPIVIESAEPTHGVEPAVTPHDHQAAASTEEVVDLFAPEPAEGEAQISSNDGPASPAFDIAATAADGLIHADELAAEFVEPTATLPPSLDEGATPLPSAADAHATSLLDEPAALESPSSPPPPELDDLHLEPAPSTGSGQAPHEPAWPTLDEIDDLTIEPEEPGAIDEVRPARIYPLPPRPPVVERVAVQRASIAPPSADLEHLATSDELDPAGAILPGHAAHDDPLHVVDELADVETVSHGHVSDDQPLEDLDELAPFDTATDEPGADREPPAAGGARRHDTPFADAQDAPQAPRPPAHSQQAAPRMNPLLGMSRDFGSFLGGIPLVLPSAPVRRPRPIFGETPVSAMLTQHPASAPIISRSAPVADANEPSPAPSWPVAPQRSVVQPPMRPVPPPVAPPRVVALPSTPLGPPADAAPKWAVPPLPAASQQSAGQSPPPPFAPPHVDAPPSLPARQQIITAPEGIIPPSPVVQQHPATHQPLPAASDVLTASDELATALDDASWQDVEPREASSPAPDLLEAELLESPAEKDHEDEPPKLFDSAPDALDGMTQALNPISDVTESVGEHRAPPRRAKSVPTQPSAPTASAPTAPAARLTTRRNGSADSAAAPSTPSTSSGQAPSTSPGQAPTSDTPKPRRPAPPPPARSSARRSLTGNSSGPAPATMPAQSRAPAEPPVDVFSQIPADQEPSFSAPEIPPSGFVPPTGGARRPRPAGTRPPMQRKPPETLPVQRISATRKPAAAESLNTEESDTVRAMDDSSPLEGESPDTVQSAQRSKKTKKRWRFPFFGLFLLLGVTAGLSAGIWYGVPVKSDLRASLRFQGLDKLSAADLQAFLLAQQANLGTDEFRKQARQIYETDYHGRPGGGFLYHSSDATQSFASIVEGARADGDRFVLGKSAGGDPQDQRLQFQAVVNALYALNRRADDAAAARQADLKNAGDRLLESQGKAQDAQRRQADFEIARQKEKDLSDRAAALKKAWDDARLAAAALHAELEALQTSAAGPRPPAEDDSQLTEMTARLKQLTDALSAARAAQSGDAGSAAAALDAALDRFQQEIDKIKPAANGAPSFLAYLGAAQQAVTAIRAAGADLAARRKLGQETLADLKRALADKVAANLKKVYAVDALLILLQQDLAVQEHRLGAAASAGLVEDAAQIRASVEEKKKSIDARTRELASAAAPTDNIRAVQKLIAGQIEQTRGEQSRAEQRFDEQFKLVAAALKPEGLPADQQQLLAALEQKLEPVNAAREQVTQSAAADVGAEVKALESQVAELQAQVDTRRRDFAATAKAVIAAVPDPAALAQKRMAFDTARQAETAALNNYTACDKELSAAQAALNSQQSAQADMVRFNADVVNLQEHLDTLKAQGTRQAAAVLLAPLDPRLENGVQIVSRRDFRPAALAALGVMFVFGICWLVSRAMRDPAGRSPPAAGGRPRRAGHHHLRHPATA